MNFYFLHSSFMLGFPPYRTSADIAGKSEQGVWCVLQGVQPAQATPLLPRLLYSLSAGKRSLFTP